jgi:hypothetical protein
MNTFCLTATNHQWVLTSADSMKPLATYRSKDRALEEAIDIASAKAGTLEIHREDGTVATGSVSVKGEGGLRCLPVAAVNEVTVPKNRTHKRHTRGHRRKKRPVGQAA